eukprot:gnl/TRDRNA2_/TRDRNA2_166158_c1_seq2.p1 gnl/TRDRNA2_/TRDRNA2_166158_c1~~gnl/TRDRNA2_/TRDRNA2_166158_c1_seq2.p1  ORF type:complete len:341 (+),score=43.78 gnl/TRDRNA2_/TRDRNA2_166158_c1_seq2:123-1025(+)
MLAGAIRDRRHADVRRLSWQIHLCEDLSLSRVCLVAWRDDHRAHVHTDNLDRVNRLMTATAETSSCRVEAALARWAATDNSMLAQLILRHWSGHMQQHYKMGLNKLHEQARLKDRFMFDMRVSWTFGKATAQRDLLHAHIVLQGWRNTVLETRCDREVNAELLSFERRAEAICEESKCLGDGAEVLEEQCALNRYQLNFLEREIDLLENHLQEMASDCASIPGTVLSAPSTPRSRSGASTPNRSSTPKRDVPARRSATPVARRVAPPRNSLRASQSEGGILAISKLTAPERQIDSDHGLY